MRERRFTQRSPAKLRRFVPSPATILSAIALLFAMAGGAVAADKINKDEVTVVTTTGAISTTGPTNGDGDAIPLTDDTFTQKAGEVLLVSAELTGTGVAGETATCDLEIIVAGGEGNGNPDNLVGLFMRQLARRGDPGDRAGSQALPAPATDRDITLSAFAQEQIPPDENGSPQEDTGQCDGGENIGGDTDTFTDTFTVSLRVSITTLRN